MEEIGERKEKKRDGASALGSDSVPHNFFFSPNACHLE